MKILLVLSLLLSGTASAAGSLRAELRAGQIQWRATLHESVGFDQRTHRFLEVTYANAYGNSICGDTNVGPSPRNVSLLFVLGAERIEVPAQVNCRGQNHAPEATVRVSGSDPLFDRLFPITSEGDRWYALKLGARTGREEVTNYENYFPLFLK